MQNQQPPWAASTPAASLQEAGVTSPRSWATPLHKAGSFEQLASSPGHPRCQTDSGPRTPEPLTWAAVAAVWSSRDSSHRQRATMRAISIGFSKYLLCKRFKPKVSRHNAVGHALEVTGASRVPPAELAHPISPAGTA